MMTGSEPITEFSQWYTSYEIDERRQCLEFKNVKEAGQQLWRQWNHFKREMDIRVGNYSKLELLADGQVINPKDDLPNISSGETAGLIRRIARSLVQNTPNVDVISKFDDDGIEGIFARHVLTSKVIGSDQYSNDMQQNLFSSTKTALTLGFDCVIPVLQQEGANGGWYMKYDTIHYRDVFPEPGVKDVREATDIFVRRYLTKGEVKQLIRNKATGWDELALRRLLLEGDPPNRERQSSDLQTTKHGTIPMGYEIITWYSKSGDPFLTFDARNMMLLRIEKNKHPLKEHPVFFLVMERDALQPFGKSQVDLLVGRQSFQDLMLNGAMKLWYRNINPSIIGYGAANAIPNLSPGKYNAIANPNAKIEAFEVNTQTLMQYGQITEQNEGSMVNLVGAPDQQMAARAGTGQSQTPQGVEAQMAQVDVTTNNYQKAIEGFFSHYCSYALTIYFQELSAVKRVTPTAEARIRLLKAGFPEEKLVDKDGKSKGDGTLDIDFEQLATEYWVRCVPGSLVELEDEKQIRILNQLFVPLSQAMPAMANSGDPEMVRQAATAMQYIISKQIELSGAANADQIKQLWMGDETEDQVETRDQKISAVEQTMSDMGSLVEESSSTTAQAITQLQTQVSQLTEINQVLLQKLGISQAPSESVEPTPAEGASTGPSLSVV